MAEVGKKNKIYVVTGESTYTVIGGELSNSFSANGEVVDITSKDDDWAKNLIGTKSWEASGSFNLNTASAQHQALQVGAAVKVFIGEISGAAPVYGVSGNANIAGVTVGAEQNAAVSLEVSFTGNGELTYHNASTTTTTTTT